MKNKIAPGHGVRYLWQCLRRFVLFFIVNSIAGYLWYLYEEELDSLDDMTATFLILFIFANIVVSALLSVIEIYGKLGGIINMGVNKLFGMTKMRRSLREESRVRLASVRHFKMQGRYDRALSAVNEVIKDDPEFPEALFLKATILWEGFGNSGAAKEYLVKVMKQVDDREESLHRWSKSLLHELGQKEKKKIPGPGRASGNDSKASRHLPEKNGDSPGN